ncbi:MULTISPECIES: ABC transporter ATP-binding protein [Rhizobium/Agrobacterium group]|uniref:ABC transporter ATP-binding protein n=1 Tax=Rhizobium/Agrobacterium group TaxID=227290 RepID=UPI0022B82BCB|nr:MULTISPECIES: ABC transporter ATP-binding protein [Rhizobium/Agrobacterium group]MCZ7889969.1 ABC transporter ATP-binding protein [Agrobacterium salinitolerans]MDA5636470.1 ABC transporter ATP-binding protein [Agrobacterium sp. ST15.16.024]MDF1892314.1 ABC transporter ATP-binding protein [Rhizobium rhizogenes]
MPDDLIIETLTSGYGRTVVIDDVSLTVKGGESVAILGRNGVGKTTLLATMMGLATVHKGSMQFAGKDLLRSKTFNRTAEGIGFVPQERLIFPSLSVHENLTVALRSDGWSTDRVYELFPRLRERRGNFGNQLSGGEQQMLALGRALVSGPKILLLDEPMEGLAPVIVQQIFAALVRLRNEEGFSILLVEQNARLALEFAPRAIILDRGKIVYDGPSAPLLSDKAILAKVMGFEADDLTHA